MVYTSFNAIKRYTHVSEKSVLLDLIKEIWTDRQGDSYISPNNFVYGGFNNIGTSVCLKSI